MKKLFKGLTLSVSALAVGFLAISLPFHLFDELSNSAMNIIFIAEIVIYLAISLIFLAIKDKRQQKKIKQAKRHLKRQEEIKDCYENWMNIAA